ncbi:MAG TPA: tRNA (adenosine(37)-N6)-threonylcarbamoyltransferase complex transferase subunit TsaD, partial [Candidatus Portnoybacteria bacterium]|nr:tRNA (adenosine(37)-N6)-threonylcarbamoyltransferase complex transferase subunit TsaD [Candidatus Portnoybacteria bacterium]
MMIPLAIETSCDETAVAILESQKDSHRILSNIVSSQIKIHAPYGGVVPNLAARAHLENIIPCLKEAFRKAKIKLEKIDTLAVTEGPGLIPALLIGTNTAKALAYLWEKPIVGINHIEGHILANWLKPKNKKFLFPAICLVVSGGHTQLILIKDYLNYKLLGQTRDDAAGEAFDKVAKLLGLGYPGGPIIARRAKKGNPQAFAFPR